MRKLISLIIIVILLLLNINLVRSILPSSQKLSGVSKIEERISILEQENKKLKGELKERSTSFYIEKEARDKLGFGKPSETIIVVPNQQQDSKKGDSQTKEKSNWEKWLELITN